MRRGVGERSGMPLGDVLKIFVVVVALSCTVISLLAPRADRCQAADQQPFDKHPGRSQGDIRAAILLPSGSTPLKLFVWSATTVARPQRARRGRSGRRWKTVTRCSPLLILYRTEGSHEALRLAA
jgi:hypothetical protein